MTAEPYAEWWEIEDASWEFEEREATRKLLSEVARIAKIPDHWREAFRVDATSLANWAYEDWQYRGGNFVFPQKPCRE